MEVTMNRFVLPTVGVLLLLIGCASVESEQTTLKSAVQSEYITVVDKTFTLRRGGNVYIFTKTDSDDELALARAIAGKLKPLGFNPIIDTGQSMEYENESFRVFIKKEMLSVMNFAFILKPGGPKGNEEHIADVKAETPKKTVEALIQFVSNISK